MLGFYQSLKDGKVSLLVHFEETEFIKDEGQVLCDMVKMPVYEGKGLRVEIKTGCFLRSDNRGGCCHGKHFTLREDEERDPGDLLVMYLLQAQKSLHTDFIPQEEVVYQGCLSASLFAGQYHNHGRVCAPW